MNEDDYHEPSEVEKSINAWRQSERKVMIDTIQDLIQTSHKYAKSQYTPSNQRARWTKLAGQLIWYKDQILKSFTLEALTIKMLDLEKQMIESNRERERESRTRNYPTIIFRKPEERKAEATGEAQNAEPSNTDKTEQPESAKEIA